MIDYLRYYDLERFLFEDVHGRFHEAGSLSAFDFFSIVIWKANRAKSRIAKRMLSRAAADSPSLDGAVRRLTATLHSASSGRERLSIMIEDWGFLLPMATAILTVMWPDEFTVYDVRACEQLGRFKNLGNRTRFQSIWPEYLEYRNAVRRAAPAGLSLRDSDRYLWARSSAMQLEQDIESGFDRQA